MYDFRADHLALDSRLRGSSLEMTNAPSLTVISCCRSLPRVGPSDGPFRSSMSVDTAIVQLLLRQLHFGGIMGVASLSFLEHAISPSLAGPLACVGELSLCSRQPTI